MPRAIRAEAHAIAVIVRLGLRVLSLRRLVTLLTHLPQSGDSRESALCASAAADAARRTGHPTCLFEALTLFAMLARRGGAVNIVIGGRRTCGFDAHAWVTLDGATVTPERSPFATARSGDYVPLWSRGVSAGTR